MKKKLYAGLMGILSLFPLAGCSQVMHKDSIFIAQNTAVYDSTNTIILVHAKKKNVSALSYYIELPADTDMTADISRKEFVCSYVEKGDKKFLLSSGQKVTDHGWKFKEWK